jgi:16S rRNA (guanine527-N7)-methyltransferase
VTREGSPPRGAEGDRRCSADGEPAGLTAVVGGGAWEVAPGGGVIRDGAAVRDDELDSGAVEPEPAVAAAVFGERLDVARRYVDALATDGVLRGLIGPREPARLWTRHVLNSAAAASLIDAGASVVDIGSGAGLPGIPLAIARGDLSVTLVEPLERRVTFLLEVIDALGLSWCRVVRGRADEVVADCGGADVVTSRAVAPLHRLAAWSAPLARDGGVVLALKGASAAEELQRDRSAVTAAGLVDPEVIEINGGVGDGVDTTYVIRARRIGSPMRGRTGRATGRRARR